MRTRDIERCIEMLKSILINQRDIHPKIRFVVSRLEYELETNKNRKKNIQISKDRNKDREDKATKKKRNV